MFFIVVAFAIAVVVVVPFAVVAVVFLHHRVSFHLFLSPSPQIQQFLVNANCKSVFSSRSIKPVFVVVVAVVPLTKKGYFFKPYQSQRKSKINREFLNNYPA